MKTGKMIIGVILLLVGLWMLFTLDNALMRYLVGGIVTILGVWMLVAGYKKGGSQMMQKPQGPTQMR